MKTQLKIKFGLLICFTLILTCNSVIFPQSAPEDLKIDGVTETQQEKSKELDKYYESALRRFEIITLSSLPFTAVHSFFMVRGVEMIRQNKFSPKLSTQNFRAIGICTACFSLFIGIRDWYMMRGKARSELLIPQERLLKPRTAETSLSSSNDRIVRLVDIQF